MNLQILFEKHDARTALLRPAGELDFRTAHHFTQTWRPLIDEGFQHFIIDLSRVGLLDSTGLGSILSLGKRVGIDYVQLVNPSPPVQIIITTTKLYRIFRCHPTVAAALRCTVLPSGNSA